MNLHDLNIFATAARLGGITKAARALSTVQSNVTARIRALEMDLGVKLFHRNHQGIELTPKGVELLPYAQQAMALVQKAREAVSEKKELEGILRIGSLQSTASTRLPEILKAYVRKHRKVDIAVEGGTAVELIDKVLNHRLDGAFVAGPVPTEALDTTVAFVEELVLVTPVSCRSVKEYLGKRSLPKVMVFKVGCFYRQKLERYLAGEGMGLLQEMEFGTLDGILGCVSAGLGMTMLPRAVVERSALRRQVRMHTLAREDRLEETRFITRKDEIHSSALERLLEIIAAHRAKTAKGRGTRD